MPCPEIDGSLDPACRSLLEAMPASDAAQAVSADALALGTGLALYRVREMLREARDGGYILEHDGQFRRSQAGDRLVAAD